MNLTDVFIKRPVLALVVSLLILVLGFMAFGKLTIRQYPKIETSVVRISTNYAGASAATMQGFVTVPIQQAIAGVDGIDFMESSTVEGSSQITVHLRPGYSDSLAQTDINAKIQSIRYKLPKEIDDPIILRAGADSSGLFYLSYYSDRLNAQQITDFLTQVIQPKLQTLEGVASADILGARDYAMRIWLDPVRMAAYYVTADDVVTTLQSSNVQATPGNLEGRDDVLRIAITTDLQSVDDFNQMVIANRNGVLIRIKDIAVVELGAENYNFAVFANGKSSVVVKINALATANPLAISKELHEIMPFLEKQLPADLHQQINYDATRFIQESVDTVVSTLFEAVLIVLVVIFLFLGTVRSVVIPVVTIPLSLVGVLFLMYLMNFSINVLTLLAMVLAIGLVVDDAIVVVENINRHLEEGLKPFDAAIKGAKEIALPVVSMTITLAAVYAPIGFVTGLTGQLFVEFAFTLAGAVIISGIIALTLSPMMCAKFLNEAQLRKPFVAFVDRVMARLSLRYEQYLGRVISNWQLVVVIALGVIGCSILFLKLLPKELAPKEDQGAIVLIATGPTNANIDFTTRYLKQIVPIYQSIPERIADVIVAGYNGVNTGISFMVLTPASSRSRSQDDIMTAIRAPLQELTGINVNPVDFPTLPGTDLGFPVQFVLTSIDSYQVLDSVANQLVETAQKSGLFLFVTTDLKIDAPKITLNINRNLAADLGISAQSIANTVGVSLSANNITRFNLNNRSYEVIPQLPRYYRLNPSHLNELYLRSAAGDRVPLSAITTIDHSVEPSSYNQFQELNSVTIMAMLMPTTTMGTAITFLQQEADKIMPEGMNYDYSGQARQYIQEGNDMYVAMVYALIIIFLVLAAQFNTFREPLVILSSFFFSAFGALLALSLTFSSTMNIFTQIALLTLIGLISKHGILIVEFANKLQEREHLSVLEATIKASKLRLRPILMTTAAMVCGMVPLLFSTMGLANSQRQLALVIVSGMLIGTCFTIFVVPTLYYLVASKYRHA